MKFICALLAVLLILPANAQRAFVSSPDPYTISAVVPLNITSGVGTYTPVNPVPPSPSTTAVIIVTGQSLGVSIQLGSYTTINAGSINFNIYDGGQYACKNPVLGVQAAPPNINSVNCQIADGLISNGTYTRVIMVPIGVGGSSCAEWQTTYADRIPVTLKRLQNANLTPATGFTGDLWIMLHQGEQDNSLGTPAATLESCWISIAQAFVNAGSGSARFFVPQSESIAGNSTGANVITAQAAIVASGCSTCRAGADWDSLTGPTNRQADGTHLTQTGAASAAALDVTIITNCKHSSC